MLWDKTQWVVHVCDELSAVFGLAPEQVHVISPFVGGAFGTTLRAWPHVTLAAMAARFVGRPVKLNRSTRDWYIQAATFACSSAAIFSTAAVTAGS
jgi:xanthine dehydrogenase YagR molybdenum-binding subunit